MASLKDKRFNVTSHTLSLWPGRIFSHCMSVGGRGGPLERENFECQQPLLIEALPKMQLSRMFTDCVVGGRCIPCLDTHAYEKGGNEQ